MLNIYFTIDVEVWSPGWKLDKASLQSAYNTYIVGKTPQGEYGLDFQLSILNDAGLKAVCFVEPLFSKAAGKDFLINIVEKCAKGGNDIQLHAHPEWLKHGCPEFKNIDFSNRYLLNQFTLDEQFEIIKEAKSLLASASGKNIQAFRAGSFCANADTLQALRMNDILIDSSYNPSMAVFDHGFNQNKDSFNATFEQNGVLELPMTVYHTYNNSLRHAQLTACTFSEMKALLLKAYNAGYTDFVILSHSVELLDRSRRKADRNNIKNLKSLVQFIVNNSDKFRCTDMSSLSCNNIAKQKSLQLNFAYSLHRALEKSAQIFKLKI